MSLFVSIYIHDDTCIDVNASMSNAPFVCLSDGDVRVFANKETLHLLEAAVKEAREKLDALVETVNHEHENVA